MTTETPISEETLKANLAKAKSDLEAANKAAAEGLAEVMKSGDYSKAASFGTAVTKATKEVADAESAISEFTRTSKWATLEAARNPVRAAIRDLVITHPITVTAESASGRILIDEDGQATVTLNVQFPKFNALEAEALIAGYVNGSDFLKAGVPSIDFTVSNIGKPDSMLTDMPTPSGKIAAAKDKGEVGQRSGSIVYSLAGKSLGMMDFLQAAADAGNDRAKKWLAASKERGNTNGASNTAKAIVEKDGVGAFEKK